MVGFTYFLQIVVFLVVIFGLFYAGNYLVNYFPGRRVKNRRMSIIEYLPLQPNAGIYLISIDGEEHVVSISNKVIHQMIPHAKKNFAEELKTKL